MNKLIFGLITILSISANAFTLECNDDSSTIKFNLSDHSRTQPLRGSLTNQNKQTNKLEYIFKDMLIRYRPDNYDYVNKEGSPLTLNFNVSNFLSKDFKGHLGYLTLDLQKPSRKDYRLNCYVTENF